MQGKHTRRVEKGRNAKQAAREKKRRILSAVIAVLIILAMVVPMLAYAVSAEAVSTESAGTSSSQDTAEASSAESTAEEAQSAAASSAENSTDGEARQGQVYIENINVTGMTLEEIQQAVAAKMSALSAEKIALYAGENTVEVTAGDMGLTYANKNIAEEAYSIGKKGNVLKRFLSENHLSKEGDIILDLDLQVKESDVRSAINEVLSGLNTEPEKNGLKMKKDGTFVVTDKKDGATVQMDTSVQLVVDYMNEGWHGGEGGVRLDATIQEAEDTSDQLSAVKDIIGSATTTYVVGNTGRNKNMELAVGLLDGTVIYPGETFSYYDTIGETTPERGFMMAPSYNADSVTESYGGGVCQVSSTLYRAVMEAELDVVERHPHSMLVSYAEPALDAAVAWGQLDLKFTNSTNNPIYLQGTIGDGEITFNIYGKETRDPGRTISLESRVTETIPYDTKYQTDSSLAFGQVKNSGGTNGLKAEAWKIIYQNGVQESEELLNSSVYNALPLVYTVGTDGCDAETKQAISAAVSDKDLNEVYQAIWNGHWE